jgi:hypothetical protein
LELVMRHQSELAPPINHGRQGLLQTQRRLVKKVLQPPS